MSTENKGIYHWKLGDVALARVCQKAYARVRVVKDEKGLFYDDKVLGISGNEDGSITVTKELCYYVETCRTNHRLWLPYTSLHLAERSRPFYGTEKVTNKDKSDVSSKTPAMLRKRTAKEEHIIPLEVNQSNTTDSDLNSTYENRQKEEGKYETAFKEFVRRGKEKMFDQSLKILNLNAHNEKDDDFLRDIEACTEEKFELVIKRTATEKEVDNHLHQCWRYHFADLVGSDDEEEVEKDSDTDTDSDSSSDSEDPPDPVTVHTPWCLVCGKGEKLRDCLTCPAAFHVTCRKKWLVTIMHRKNLRNNLMKPVTETMIDKIISGTRIKCTLLEDKENRNEKLCPSCTWGPQVGYDDIVWNKLGTCGWWPARVLTPGEVPPCLLAKLHTQHDWPLKYYGTLNHSWGAASRTCLFLPSHTAGLGAGSELNNAVMDANDEYITVYLA